MLVFRKVNSLPLLCRVQTNGDASVAFRHPPSHSWIQGSLVSVGYMLDTLGLSFLFSTCIAVTYDASRNSRASGNRPDVWYWKFSCVGAEKAQSFF